MMVANDVDRSILINRGNIYICTYVHMYDLNRTASTFI